MEDLIKDITITEIKPNDLIIIRANKELQEADKEGIISMLRNILPNKIIIVNKDVDIRIERG